MRPGQQNKRGRGRNNNNNSSNNGGGGGGGGNHNNRKGSNPLTRTYDSSGPDVKIRGTAQHVAEKYMNLARDAQSSGDRVMAENYLQHAEHYNRIILSAQAQMQERFQRDDRDDRNERGDDGSDRDQDDQDMGGDTQQPSFQQNERQQNERRPNERQQGERQHGERQQSERQPAAQQPANDGSGPQPVIEGMPAEVAIEEQQVSGDTKPRRRTAARPRRQPRRGEKVGDEGDADAGPAADAPALAGSE